MKTAKLFQHGEHQAVAMPEEFRFEDSEVYIKHVGNAVVLLPIKGTWKTVFAGLDLFSDDFIGERIQPETQSRKDLR